jgi:hypothetical protein
MFHRACYGQPRRVNEILKNPVHNGWVVRKGERIAAPWRLNPRPGAPGAPLPRAHPRSVCRSPADWQELREQAEQLARLHDVVGLTAARAAATGLDFTDTMN